MSISCGVFSIEALVLEKRLNFYSNVLYESPKYLILFGLDISGLLMERFMSGFQFFNNANNFLITAGISVNMVGYLFHFLEIMSLDDDKSNNEKYPQLKVAFLNPQLENGLPQLETPVNKIKDAALEALYALSDRLYSEDLGGDGDVMMTVAYNKEKERKKEQEILELFYSLDHSD